MTEPWQPLAAKTGAIPIWWAALHTVSKSVTAASVASIPCAPELASVEYRLSQDKIDDPSVRQELAAFTDECYRRSKSRLMRSDTSTMTAAQLEDTNWLGSVYFLTTAGFYNRYYAQAPQPLFAFDAARDAGFDSDALAGGHPVCTQWWGDAATGIRRRVLDSLDPGLLDDMVYDADNLVSESTDTALAITERENVLLRKYLAVTRASESLAVNLPMSTGYSATAAQKLQQSLDNGNWVNTAVGTLSLGAHFIQDVGRTAVVAAGVAIKARKPLVRGT